MGADDKASLSRKSIRFDPEPLDSALIAVSNLTGTFTPEHSALIYDESPDEGCSLVVLDQSAFRVGEVCVVQVGRAAPVDARIVWKKELKPRLVHIGLEFLN